MGPRTFRRSVGVSGAADTTPLAVCRTNASDLRHRGDKTKGRDARLSVADSLSGSRSENDSPPEYLGKPTTPCYDQSTAIESSRTKLTRDYSTLCERICWPHSSM